MNNTKPIKPATLYVVCPSCRTVAGECETAAEVAQWPTCAACGMATTIRKTDPRRKPAHRGGIDPSKYFLPEEMEKIRDYVRTLAKFRSSREAQRTWLMLEMLACTGIRAFELCQLELRDLPHTGGPATLYVRDGKGSVSAPVDIPTALAEVIIDYVAQWRAGDSAESTLFESRTGEPLKYLVLYRKLVRIGEDLKLRARLTPHTMRRSFGVGLYALEHDLLLVKRQLRHASIKTTQRYAETLPANARRQIERMG
jgi:integrase